KLLDEYECIFSIVDYHAITVPYDAAVMQERIINAAMDNMAAGLDQSKCTLFIQSDVPEHTELCWLLNCVTPMGELGRMTQFKEKSRQHQDNINAGLLNYPILQAADILVYRADAVPVGEDQAQHLEFTREVARRFNSTFGEFFKEPETLIGRGARVRGLDGENKMSKSLGNYIAVTEPQDSIWEKLRPAKTDEARKRRTDPGNPFVCNIYSYHELVTPEEQRLEIRQGCTGAQIGCIDCKKILFENLMRVLTPIRERRAELEKDVDSVRSVLKENGRKCREIASKTVSDVKKVMGLS
ncbi:MAG TPA: tryptophan--tRNA ligase, partial [bacterium]|nr:tryptophan--tRNA ligase [bacterium]